MSPMKRIVQNPLTLVAMLALVAVIVIGETRTRTESRQLVYFDDSDGTVDLLRLDSAGVVMEGTLDVTGAVTLTGVVTATSFATSAAAVGSNLSGATWAADGTTADIDLNLTPKGTGDVEVSGTLWSVASGAATVASLEVDGAADFDSTVAITTSLAVDDVDAQTATALLIGKATATSVEIADTLVDTNVQGTLSVDEAASFDTTVAVTTSLEVPVVQAPDNGATLSVNIPVSGTDAGLHTLAHQIDGTAYLSAAATGDGGGGIGAITVTAANDYDFTATGGGSGTADLDVAGYVQFAGTVEFDGTAQHDGRAIFADDVDIDFNASGEIFTINTTDIGAGYATAMNLVVANNTVESSGQSAFAIQDGRSGSEADEPTEASLEIAASGAYAFYVQSGKSNFKAAIELDDVALEIEEGADTLTITVPALTADRAVTFGDLAGEVVLDTATQTLSGKTLTSPLIDDGDAGVTVTSADQTDAGATATIPDMVDAADSFVLNDTAATMTNKTLTSPVLDTGVSGTAFLDEDNMASDSATQLASQQSIKAYTDTAVALRAALAGATFTGPVVLDDTSLQIQEGADTLTITTPALTADRAVTFGDLAGEVVLDTATQTLENKTIDGDDNTVQDLGYGTLKAAALYFSDTYYVRNNAVWNDSEGIIGRLNPFLQPRTLVRVGFLVPAPPAFNAADGTGSTNGSYSYNVFSHDLTAAPEALFSADQTVSAATRPTAVWVTTDSGANYTDYTSEATDDSDATDVPISNLDGTAGDWIVVGYSEPFHGIGIGMDAADKNGNAVTSTAEYATGVAAFATAVTSLNDGTETGGAMFGQSGTINYTMDNEVWTPYALTNGVDGTARYWIRISSSGAMDASANINEVYTIYPDGYEFFATPDQNTGLTTSEYLFMQTKEVDSTVQNGQFRFISSN